MATITDGNLIDTSVTKKIFTGLHMKARKLNSINAIVVHQTGASNAEATFNSYKTASHGAHFLVDKTGKIYQTALLTQITYHVGKIKSLCIDIGFCTAKELKDSNAIYFKKGHSYSVRLQNLHKHEIKKTYPNRYPTNEDSIGIELVGKYDGVKKSYETVTTDQNTSLKWLVDELGKLLVLDEHDVFRHPQVSRKKPSEAETAKWR